MTPLKQRKVESSLEKKGFKKRGTHHLFFTYHRLLDGKKTSVFTKLSQSGRELGPPLIRLMARQCRLKTKDFLELIECPLERKEYEVKLEEQGLDLRGEREEGEP